MKKVRQSLSVGHGAIGGRSHLAENRPAALDSIGIENDIHVYDEVNHGFWLRVDGDRATGEAPARDAWGRLMQFLGRTVGE